MCTARPTPRSLTGCSVASLALAASRKAVALARAGGGPYNLAMALAYAGVTHQMRDNLPGLREAVGELRDLCDRYDFAYYRGVGAHPGRLVPPGR
jgi:hypothetical protein